jgi:quercetin dioxygenase-like cupin family protein
MISKRAWLVGTGLLGLSALMQPAQSAEDAAAAQKHKSVMITRIYTGPDGQSHAEEIEVKFAPGGGNDVHKLMANAGAELHRAPPGRVSDWHTAPRRQYVITLSGRGELELSGGQKVSVGPGHIELVEDTTGKGHITKTVGTEDRVTIQVPISDR